MIMVVGFGELMKEEWEGPRRHEGTIGERIFGNSSGRRKCTQLMKVGTEMDLKEVRSGQQRRGFDRYFLDLRLAIEPES